MFSSSKRSMVAFLAAAFVLPVILWVLPAHASVFTGVGACAPAGTTPGQVSQWDHVIVVTMENQKSTKMLGQQAVAAVGGTSANSFNALADACGSNSGHNAVTGSWDTAPLYNFRNTSHKSLTNYLALTSGNDYNETLGLNGGVPAAGEDCDASTQSCKQGTGQYGDNLFRALDRAGVSWKQYAEAMGTACNTTDNVQTNYSSVINPNGYTSANYAARHAPAVYYGVNPYGSATTDSGTLPNCSSKVVDMNNPTTGFFQDINNNTLPKFSIISPALCNDMHAVSGQCSGGGASGTAANNQSSGQRYLMGTSSDQGLLDYIVNSNTYQDSNTLVIVWWDEAGGNDASASAGFRCYDDTTTADNCYTPLIVMSKATPAGSQLTTKTNHYGMLKMLQDLLGAGPTQGVPYIGHAADADSASFASDFNLTPSGGGSIQTTPPAASTAAATSVTSSAATLNGTVNPNGKATSYHFEYGTTTSYGTSVPVPDASAGSGTTTQAVSYSLSGLSASTVYHYRITATNADGTVTSSDQTFQTSDTSGATCGTYTAPDIADTYVNELYPNSSKGSDSTMKVSYGGSPAAHKIAMIRFDTSVIPATCVVDSATVSLTNGSGSTYNNQNLTISSVTDPDTWQEATLDYASLPSIATTTYTGNSLNFSAGGTLTFAVTPGSWLKLGSSATSSLRFDSTTGGAKDIATKEQTNYAQPVLTIVTHASESSNQVQAAAVLSSGTVTATSATLNWTAAPDATTYTLQRNGATVYTGTDLTFTDTGLSANTTYSYIVTATGPGGSADSNTVSVTTPTTGALTEAWNLDENPINANSTVLESILGLNGTTPANWSGSHVAPLDSTGTGAFYFPGWTQLVNGNQVDASASSFTIPNNDNLNPGTKDFSVSFWVNALDPANLVSSGVIENIDTLNIVQKGLSGASAQQWKVSYNPAGKFICTFRGPDANGTVVNYNVKSATLAFATTRQITCGLSNGTITLTIKTGSQKLSYTAAGPVNGVTNTEDVTVGKKPGTTYPGDTFAGTIDNLTVTKAQ